MTQHSPNETDLALMRRIASGNTDALSILYARYGLKLLSYLISQVDEAALAEELLQDLMLAV